MPRQKRGEGRQSDVTPPSAYGRAIAEASQDWRAV